MQVAAPAVGNLADPRNFVMMVKGFSSEKMKLAGEQHAHHEGMRPDPEPEFPPTSHCTNCDLPRIGNACLTLLNLNDTKTADTNAALNRPLHLVWIEMLRSQNKLHWDHSRFHPAGLHRHRPRCQTGASALPNPISAMI